MFKQVAYVFFYLALSSSAYAIPIAFEFGSGDAALSGTFKYDFTTKIYSDIDITGIVSTYHWGPTDEGYSPVYRYTLWQVWESEAWAGPSLRITWLGAPGLTPDGGSYSGFEYLGCSGPVCSVRSWEGSVNRASTVTIPVPALHILVMCGLTLLALTRRRPLLAMPLRTFA